MKTITLILASAATLLLSNCAATNSGSCCATGTMACCKEAAAKGMKCDKCAAMKAGGTNKKGHDMKAM